MTERDWLRGDGLPRYLEATEKSRSDFSWLSWRLMGIANVARRDVTEHSDWVRYCGIAIFMLAFTVYAFAGWLAFLSTAGVGRLGRLGGATEVVGALLGAGATLVFDRVLVGTTKPQLDLEVAPTGEPGARSLPSFVAKGSRAPIVARVAVAFVIGVFTTQAADLKLFAKDIDKQRAAEVVADKKDELQRLDEQHQKVAAAAQAEDPSPADQLKTAQARMRHAQHYSGGFCRRYKRRGSKELSDCEQARQLAKSLTDQLGAQAAAEKKYKATRTALERDIVSIPDHPQRTRSSAGGPSDDTKTLYRFLWANPISWTLYAAVLVLGLLLDLAAILLKIAGFDSNYERRQALRGWRSWWESSSAEQLRLGRRRRRLRTEKRKDDVAEEAEREAARTETERVALEHRGMREAFARALDDSEVRARADALAVAELLAWLDARENGHHEPPPPPAPGEEEEQEEGRRPEWKPGRAVAGRAKTWILVRPVDHPGGHASVWLAHDRDDETALVAIKVMPMPGEDRRGRQLIDIWSMRARRDRKWLESFQDRPNDDRSHLVELADVGDAEGQLWHATWWASRGTLHEYYAVAAERPLAEVLDFARQIVLGLRESGSGAKGFPVHGDLKPANLLLDDPGEDAPRGSRLRLPTRRTTRSRRSGSRRRRPTAGVVPCTSSTTYSRSERSCGGASRASPLARKVSPRRRPAHPTLSGGVPTNCSPRRGVR
jgi:hypothetical protein